MLKPLRGYVLVEQTNEELTTASGIALPESSKDKPIKGVIIEVGAEVLTASGSFLECDLEPGQKVIYKRWSTTDLEEDGKKLSFVAFQDILGVYE